MGATLASRGRYEKYKPADVTNERWEELLGADVNNLDHLPLTYGLTKSMIRNLRESQPGFLSEHEEDVLQAASLIHDWAEAIVGDITYGYKTVEQESEEMEHLVAILEKHYEDDNSDIKPLIIEAAGIVREPDTKLGHVFNTIERVGYMRTALRASRHVIADTTPDCEAGLRWLVADVFGNHPAVLIERSSTYVPVGVYLQNQCDAITKAFSIVSHSTFATNYPIEEQTRKETAFRSNQEAWEQWMNAEERATISA
jgi:hypothetical protein